MSNMESCIIAEQNVKQVPECVCAYMKITVLKKDNKTNTTQECPRMARSRPSPFQTELCAECCHGDLCNSNLCQAERMYTLPIYIKN